MSILEELDWRGLYADSTDREALTKRLADQLRANGQDVTPKIYPDEDHSGTVLASVPDSTPFLAAAFAGG